MRIAAGDPHARLPALRKSALSGHCKLPDVPRALHGGSAMQGPHVAGLNSAIPSGVFRIGKGLAW